MGGYLATQITWEYDSEAHHWRVPCTQANNEALLKVYTALISSTWQATMTTAPRHVGQTPLQLQTEYNSVLLDTQLSAPVRFISLLSLSNIVGPKSSSMRHHNLLNQPFESLEPAVKAVLNASKQRCKERKEEVREPRTDQLGSSRMVDEDQTTAAESSFLMPDKTYSGSGPLMAADESEQRLRTERSFRRRDNVAQMEVRTCQEANFVHHYIADDAAEALFSRDLIDRSRGPPPPTSGGQRGNGAGLTGASLRSPQQQRGTGSRSPSFRESADGTTSSGTASSPPTRRMHPSHPDDFMYSLWDRREDGHFHAACWTVRHLINHLALVLGFATPIDTHNSRSVYHKAKISPLNHCASTGQITYLVYSKGYRYVLASTVEQETTFQEALAGELRKVLEGLVAQVEVHEDPRRGLLKFFVTNSVSLYSDDLVDTDRGDYSTEPTVDDQYLLEQVSHNPNSLLFHAMQRLAFVAMHSGGSSPPVGYGGTAGSQQRTLLGSPMMVGVGGVPASTIGSSTKKSAGTTAASTSSGTFGALETSVVPSPPPDRHVEGSVQSRSLGESPRTASLQLPRLTIGEENLTIAGGSPVQAKPSVVDQAAPAAVGHQEGAGSEQPQLPTPSQPATTTRQPSALRFGQSHQLLVDTTSSSRGGSFSATVDGTLRSRQVRFAGDDEAPQQLGQDGLPPDELISSIPVVTESLSCTVEGLKDGGWDGYGPEEIAQYLRGNIHATHMNVEPAPIPPKKDSLAGPGAEGGGPGAAGGSKKESPLGTEYPSGSRLGTTGSSLDGTRTTEFAGRSGTYYGSTAMGVASMSAAGSAHVLAGLDIDLAPTDSLARQRLFFAFALHRLDVTLHSYEHLQRTQPPADDLSTVATSSSTLLLASDDEGAQKRQRLGMKLTLFDPLTGEPLKDTAKFKLRESTPPPVWTLSELDAELEIYEVQRWVEGVTHYKRWKKLLRETTPHHTSSSSTKMDDSDDDAEEEDVDFPPVVRRGSKLHLSALFENGPRSSARSFTTSSADTKLLRGVHWYDEYDAANGYHGAVWDRQRGIYGRLICIVGSGMEDDTAGGLERRRSHSSAARRRRSKILQGAASELELGRDVLRIEVTSDGYYPLQASSAVSPPPGSGSVFEDSLEVNHSHDGNDRRDNLLSLLPKPTSDRYGTNTFVRCAGKPFRTLKSLLESEAVGLALVPTVSTVSKDNPDGDSGSQPTSCFVLAVPSYARDSLSFVEGMTPEEFAVLPPSLRRCIDECAAEEHKLTQQKLRPVIEPPLPEDEEDESLPKRVQVVEAVQGLERTKSASPARSATAPRLRRSQSVNYEGNVGDVSFRGVSGSMVPVVATDAPTASFIPRSHAPPSIHSTVAVPKQTETKISVFDKLYNKAFVHGLPKDAPIGHLSEKEQKRMMRLRQLREIKLAEEEQAAQSRFWTLRRLNAQPRFSREGGGDGMIPGAEEKNAMSLIGQTRERRAAFDVLYPTALQRPFALRHVIAALRVQSFPLEALNSAYRRSVFGGSDELPLIREFGVAESVPEEEGEEEGQGQPVPTLKEVNEEESSSTGTADRRYSGSSPPPVAMAGGSVTPTPLTGGTPGVSPITPSSEMMQNRSPSPPLVAPRRLSITNESAWLWPLLDPEAQHMLAAQGPTPHIGATPPAMDEGFSVGVLQGVPLLLGNGFDEGIDTKECKGSATSQVSSTSQRDLTLSMIAGRTMTYQLRQPGAEGKDALAAALRFILDPSLNTNWSKLHYGISVLRGLVIRPLKAHSDEDDDADPFADLHERNAAKAGVHHGESHKAKAKKEEEKKKTKKTHHRKKDICIDGRKYELLSLTDFVDDVETLHRLITQLVAVLVGGPHNTATFALHLLLPTISQEPTRSMVLALVDWEHFVLPLSRRLGACCTFIHERSPHHRDDHQEDTPTIFRSNSMSRLATVIGSPGTTRSRSSAFTMEALAPESLNLTEANAAVMDDIRHGFHKSCSKETVLHQGMPPEQRYGMIGDPNPPQSPFDDSPTAFNSTEEAKILASGIALLVHETIQADRTPVEAALGQEQSAAPTAANAEKLIEGGAWRLWLQSTSLPKHLQWLLKKYPNRRSLGVVHSIALAVLALLRPPPVCVQRRVVRSYFSGRMFRRFSPFVALFVSQLKRNAALVQPLRNNDNHALSAVLSLLAELGTFTVGKQELERAKANDALNELLRRLWRKEYSREVATPLLISILQVLVSSGCASPETAVLCSRLFLEMCDVRRNGAVPPCISLPLTNSTGSFLQQFAPEACHAPDVSSETASTLYAGALLLRVMHQHHSTVMSNVPFATIMLSLSFEMCYDAAGLHEPKGLEEDVEGEGEKEDKATGIGQTEEEETGPSEAKTGGDDKGALTTTGSETTATLDDQDIANVSTSTKEGVSEDIERPEAARKVLLIHHREYCQPFLNECWLLLVKTLDTRYSIDDQEPFCIRLPYNTLSSPAGSGSDTGAGIGTGAFPLPPSRSGSTLGSRCSSPRSGGINSSPLLSKRVPSSSRLESSFGSFSMTTGGGLSLNLGEDDLSHQLQLRVRLADHQRGLIEFIAETVHSFEALLRCQDTPGNDTSQPAAEAAGFDEETLQILQNNARQALVYALLCVASAVSDYSPLEEGDDSDTGEEEEEGDDSDTGEEEEEGDDSDTGEEEEEVEVEEAATAAVEGPRGSSKEKAVLTAIAAIWKLFALSAEPQAKTLYVNPAHPGRGHPPRCTSSSPLARTLERVQSMSTSALSWMLSQRPRFVTEAAKLHDIVTRQQCEDQRKNDNRHNEEHLPLPLLLSILANHEIALQEEERGSVGASAASGPGAGASLSHSATPDSVSLSPSPPSALLHSPGAQGIGAAPPSSAGRRTRGGAEADEPVEYRKALLLLYSTLGRRDEWFQCRSMFAEPDADGQFLRLALLAKPEDPTSRSAQAFRQRAAALRGQVASADDGMTSRSATMALEAIDIYLHMLHSRQQQIVAFHMLTTFLQLHSQTVIEQMHEYQPAAEELTVNVEPQLQLPRSIEERRKSEPTTTERATEFTGLRQQLARLLKIAISEGLVKEALQLLFSLNASGVSPGESIGTGGIGGGSGSGPSQSSSQQQQQQQRPSGMLSLKEPISSARATLSLEGLLQLGGEVEVSMVYLLQFLLQCTEIDPHRTVTAARSVIPDGIQILSRILHNKGVRLIVRYLARDLLRSWLHSRKQAKAASTGTGK